MKNKSFWKSVIGVWLFIWVTDFLFHGMWLQPDYQATSHIWRPMEEMQKMFPIMWFGQFVFSWAFVWIFTKGITSANQWHQAFRYALAILFVAKIPEVLGFWATAPVPGDLAFKWALIYVVQAFGASFFVTWIYQPSKNTHWQAAA